MGDYIWNGEKRVHRREALIDPEDRGYTFGDGVYEVFRIYHGTCFEAEAHWERLARSLSELRINLGKPVSDLSRGIETFLREEDINDGMLYLQVTRGAAPRAHPFPSADTPPVITAFTKPLTRPSDALEHGASAVIQPDIRWLRCDIKSLNLLPNVLAKQAASEAGAQEAILHRDGTVTEGSASNAAIVSGGVLWTHPANHLILHGVTRAVTLKLAREIGIPVREEPFTLDMLHNADEAFMMGTTVEVMPIVRIDGKPVATGVPGAVTRRLQKAFEAYIEARP